MNGYVEMGRVLSNREIGTGVWFMELYAPKQAQTAQVGQFCNVRVTSGSAPFLRRPISYAGFNRDKGTIQLLYRQVGVGTGLMTKLKDNDILDCLGPLGRPFELSKHMLLIGGGVGIAPMLCATQQKEEGQKVTVILGFKEKSELFWSDLFTEYNADVHITTDDGSVGIKGFPTAAMPELIRTSNFTSVLTCGPMPMMKGVAQVAKEFGVPCQVSFEARMGCGTGGCFGCGCDGRDGKRYKVCQNGPVFPAEEVFF